MTNARFENLKNYLLAGRIVTVKGTQQYREVEARMAELGYAIGPGEMDGLQISFRLIPGEA